MAALKIGRSNSKQREGKREDGGLLSRSKCPVFTVQYLGKLPARGEYGREFISEPVECLLKLRDRQRLPKTTLTVSDKGFHFLDENGPFGKEKHVLVPLHNICYGVADEKSPCVFAIITRTDSNSDSSLFECHAFLCDKRKTSSEITYWLLRTFLQVFEDLQKKRRLRQERKLLRRQQNDGTEGVAEIPKEARSPKNRSSYSSEKPFETGSYSVILEGNKSHGAAVGLTLDRSRSRQAIRGSLGINSRGYEHSRRNNDRELNANFYSRSEHGPLMAVSADVHPHTSQMPHMRTPQPYGTRNGRSTYIYSGGIHASSHQSARHQHSQLNRTNVVQRLPPSSGSYTRNDMHSPHVHVKEPPVNQSSIRDESDFIFIDLLQEEFTDGRHEDGFSVSSGRRGDIIGPPNQKLRSEDIERRIREWLSAREESSDDVSVFVDDVKTKPGESLRRQISGGDTASLASSDSYF